MITTSGGACTEAPSIADKLSNGSVTCASALATRAEVSPETLTISHCRFTLAAVMPRLVWQSGGGHENCALSAASNPACATWSKSLTAPLTL